MKDNKNKRKIILYSFIFLVLFFGSVYFFRQARLCQNEFRDSFLVQEISASMTIGLVTKQFGIPEEEIFRELKMPTNHWNRRFTILEACQKKKLDCAQIVTNLNKKILK